MWRSDIARTAVAQHYQRYVWFVAWPLILLALFASCGGRSSSTADPDGAVRDQVSRYGGAAILAFITAGPADGARVETFFGGLVKPPAGQQAIPLPRETVLASFASAEPQRAQGDWRVALTAVTSGGVVNWQVPVRVLPSGFRVLGLPGLMPGLPTGPAVTVDAAAVVDPKSDAPVAVTLRDFFTAWLTGSGDLGRVADVSSVPTFAAAPFSRVTVMEASAGAAIPESPQGTVSVRAVVWGMNTQTTQLSYDLDLTAVSGRWVVSDVAAQPAVRVDNTTPTASAGP